MLIKAVIANAMKIVRTDDARQFHKITRALSRAGIMFEASHNCDSGDILQVCNAGYDAASRQADQRAEAKYYPPMYMEKEHDAIGKMAEKAQRQISIMNKLMAL